MKKRRAVLISLIAALLLLSACVSAKESPENDAHVPSDPSDGTVSDPASPSQTDPVPLAPYGEARDFSGILAVNADGVAFVSMADGSVFSGDIKSGVFSHAFAANSIQMYADSQAVYFTDAENVLWRLDISSPQQTVQKVADGIISCGAVNGKPAAVSTENKLFYISGDKLGDKIADGVVSINDGFVYLSGNIRCTVSDTNEITEYCTDAVQVKAGKTTLLLNQYGEIYLSDGQKDAPKRASAVLAKNAKYIVLADDPYSGGEVFYIDNSDNLCRCYPRYAYPMFSTVEDTDISVIDSDVRYAAGVSGDQLVYIKNDGTLYSLSKTSGDSPSLAYAPREILRGTADGIPLDPITAKDPRYSEPRDGGGVLSVTSSGIVVSRADGSLWVTPNEELPVFFDTVPDDSSKPMYALDMAPRKMLLNRFENFIIDENGTLWGFGRLVPTAYEPYEKTNMVRILEDIADIQTTGNTDFAFALLNNGDVYMWGDARALSGTLEGYINPPRLIMQNAAALGMTGGGMTLLGTNGELYLLDYTCSPYKIGENIACISNGCVIGKNSKSYAVSKTGLTEKPSDNISAGISCEYHYTLYKNGDLYARLASSSNTPGQKIAGNVVSMVPYRNNRSAVFIDSEHKLWACVGKELILIDTDVEYADSYYNSSIYYIKKDNTLWSGYVNEEGKTPEVNKTKILDGITPIK